MNTSAPSDEEDEPQLDTTRGWQRPASKAVDEFGFRSILRELDPPAAALLDSQAGPFAARIFTARPTSPELSLAPSHFRVLLLRRLLYGSLCCSLPPTVAADVAKTL